MLSKMKYWSSKPKVDPKQAAIGSRATDRDDESSEDENNMRNVKKKGN